MNIQPIDFQHSTVRQNTTFGSKKLMPTDLSEETIEVILKKLRELYGNLVVPRKSIMEALKSSDSFARSPKADVLNNGIWFNSSKDQRYESAFGQQRLVRVSYFERNGEGYCNPDLGGKPKGPQRLSLKEVKHILPEYWTVTKYYNTKNTSGDLQAVRVANTSPNIITFHIKNGKVSSISMEQLD